MSDRLVFLFGTLRYAPHLAAVLGHDGAEAQAATLLGYEVRCKDGPGYPFLVEAPGRTTEGLLLSASPQDFERMAYYERAFGYGVGRCRVRVDGQEMEAEMFRPSVGTWAAGPLWSLEDWVNRHGEIETRAAVEVMSEMGRRPAEEVGARAEQIDARAASWIRAQAHPSPRGVRIGPEADAIDRLDHRRPYLRYFAVEEADVRFPRFGGGMSDKVERAVFMMTDAVTVLPYDPVRDRALIIEQFRAGPYLRGDPRPWLLEPIAGRIDPGEDPETTARREAEEEAGLKIGDLHLVATYYVSPGAVTEYLYSYIGIADLPDEAAGVAGLEAESEDIRSHVLSFDALMELVETGDADNGPLLLSILALARRRERLRSIA